MYETYYIPNTYQKAKFRMFLNLLYEELEDTNYIWVADTNDEVTLLLYLGTKRAVKVPKEIEGKTVTKIGCTCYAYNTDLISVIIPEGITIIE
jgi:hypothetical protein